MVDEAYQVELQNGGGQESNVDTPGGRLIYVSCFPPFASVIRLPFGAFNITRKGPPCGNMAKVLYIYGISEQIFRLFDEISGEP